MVSAARVLTQALLWRLTDLEEADGRPIELVIATKFPSYAIRHPNKVVWLVHQFRQAYELDGTAFGQFGPDPFDRATRRAVHRLDDVVLGEARKLFAISQNVVDRLRAANGLEAEVLRPPPQELEYRCEEYGDLFSRSAASIARSGSICWCKLSLRTRSSKRSWQERAPTARGSRTLAAELGLDHRLRFVGRVDDAELASLYATCLGVFYAPVDEDLGLVPYEAFLSEKPVVTTSDAGGPLEVVLNEKTGLVCEPDPAAVAAAVARLASSPDEARAWGKLGRRWQKS